MRGFWKDYPNIEVARPRHHCLAQASFTVRSSFVLRRAWDFVGQGACVAHIMRCMGGVCRVWGVWCIHFLEAVSGVAGERGGNLFRQHPLDMHCPVMSGPLSNRPPHHGVKEGPSLPPVGKQTVGGVHMSCCDVW